MRVPYSWLREYCDPGVPVEELADRLVMTGTEVERIDVVGPPAPDNFVIGKVTGAAQHPDADRLRVCTVDVGDGAARTIVCGAPNVAAGQTVAVAGVDHAGAEPVGFRVLLALDDLADDEALGRGRPHLVEALDLGPGHHQAIGQRLRVHARVAVLAQPGVRDSHPNCSSIRTSLSKKRRRSGTPWRSIATRSTPIPKAKPCTRSAS